MATAGLRKAVVAVEEWRMGVVRVVEIALGAATRVRRIMVGGGRLGLGLDIFFFECCGREFGTVVDGSKVVGLDGLGFYGCRILEMRSISDSRHRETGGKWS